MSPDFVGVSEQNYNFRYVQCYSTAFKRLKDWLKSKDQKINTLTKNSLYCYF